MLEPTNFDYLQANTREVLAKLVETADFLPGYSLVGGSALALYLCHRKSEDLDFFTYADSFDRQTHTLGDVPVKATKMFVSRVNGCS